jgi:hybrid cluster-associated redox disulfide protein
MLTKTTNKSKVTKKKLEMKTTKVKIKKSSLKKQTKSKLEVKKEMTFAQLLTKKPEAMNILFENGLHCIGCHMSAYETIEQGCLAHGMSKEDIENLIKQLNK